jgi:hypothetical protein
MPKPVIRATIDGLTNVMSSLGTLRNKRSWSQFQYALISQFELEAAYQPNWIARAIFDLPNEDTTREGRLFGVNTPKRRQGGKTPWHPAAHAGSCALGRFV